MKLVYIINGTVVLPDGEYELEGQPIFIEGIECRLSDGTMARSVLKFNEPVRMPI